MESQMGTDAAMVVGRALRRWQECLRDDVPIASRSSIWIEVP